MSGGSGFRAARTPVLRGKSDAPEGWARRGKFQAYFGFVSANRSKESDVTFLLFASPLVLQGEQAAAGDPRLQQNERSVSIDRQRVGFFVEGSRFCVASRNFDGDLHQDALAAAANSGVYDVAWRLGHGGSIYSDYTAGDRVSAGLASKR